MNQTVTVLAPIKLAPGKTEEDLMIASNDFQKNFVAQQQGVLRRELIRTSEGRYLDIVQFRSKEDALKVIEEEGKSPVCQKFFSLMDFTDADSNIEFHTSLATYS